MLFANQLGFKAQGLSLSPLSYTPGGVPACGVIPGTQVQAPAQSRNIPQEKPEPLAMEHMLALPAFHPGMQISLVSWLQSPSGTRGFTKGMKDPSVQTVHRL